jgi:hypothetical protein
MRASELVCASLAWYQGDIHRLKRGDFDRTVRWSRLSGRKGAGREESRAAEIMATIALIYETQLDRLTNL